MLAKYQEYQIPEYLDGRYFEKVMKSIDRFAVALEPLVIRIIDDKLYTNQEAFAELFTMIAPTMYARVIVEVVVSGKSVMRHSQLLIIEQDTVIYFEPDYIDNKYYENTKMIVEEIFPDYNLNEYFLETKSSRKRIIGGYCVAYVLKFAYYHAIGEFDKVKQETDWDIDDIRKFSKMVEYMYGPPEKGYPDIEFGTTDTVIGGLGGAGLGYVVGGPAGALIGGAGGAYLGSRLGSK